MTHHLVLTSISDFFPSSEVATTRQTDSAAHKLKPRSFHKSAHFQVHSSVNCAWQYYQTPKSAVASEQFHLLNPLLQFHLQSIPLHTSKSNNNFCLFTINKISYYIWFDIFESSIKISNMTARCLHEFVLVFIIHWNNYLLSQWFFHSHIDIFTKMEGEMVTKLAGLSTGPLFTNLFLISWIQGVNLAVNFCLKK